MFNNHEICGNSRKLYNIGKEGRTLWLTLVGLVLEILGVGLLLFEELTALSAIIKQADEEKRNEGESIVVDSSFQKLPVVLAKYFGSSASLAMQSFDIEKFTTRFYGFCLLFIGFVLQAVSVIKQIICT